MLGAVTGAGLGVFAIYVDIGSWDHATRAFARSGSFVFWVALLAAQTMIWTLALQALTSTFHRHWTKRQQGSVRGEVLPSALVLALLVALVVVVPRLAGELPNFIPHQHLKIATLTGLALLVALVAAMSIWLIRGRAEALAGKTAIDKDDLKLYLGLRLPRFR